MIYQSLTYLCLIVVPMCRPTHLKYEENENLVVCNQKLLQREKIA